MVFQNFIPTPALQDYFKEYHLRHFSFDPKAKIPIKAFPPRPEQYLLFYPRGFETSYNATGGDSQIKPTYYGSVYIKVNEINFIELDLAYY
jgi:hypothetical protein